MGQTLLGSPFGLHKVSASTVFINHGTKIQYKARETIYQQGDVADSVYYLESGIVKIGIISSNGEERTLTINEPGTMFGEARFWGKLIQITNAVALGNCTVYSLQDETLIKRLFDTTNIANDIINSLVEKLQICVDHIQQTSFEDAPTRIIRVIWKLAQHHGCNVPRGLKINVYLTHEELGWLCGVCRVTVSKTINKLIQDGVLAKDKRKLIITDKVKLQKMLLEDI